MKDFTCKKCIRGVLYQDEDKMINLNGDTEVVNRFSYFGDVLNTEGETEEAVTSRIRSALKKFKEFSNVISGKNISLKVCEKYLIQQLCEKCLTYDVECRALRVEDEKKLKTTEMRMLRTICGKTLKDKINIEKIRVMTGVKRF